MSRSALVLTLLVLALASGCGSGNPDSPHRPRALDLAEDCAEVGTAMGPNVKADLDGDGDPELVEYFHGLAKDGCPAAMLVAYNMTKRAPAVRVDDGLAPEDHGMEAIAVPGRRGDLVVVRLRHPRGGFQAHLYGYADGALKELTVDREPIFPFVATDVLTTPISARCTDGGFVVTQARAHEPIGVVPAWDIDRTTYAVDGNTVAKGATSEIADNVLDAELERKYADLVTYDLFSDCLVAH